jgi:hypothetical protein
MRYIPPKSRFSHEPQGVTSPEDGIFQTDLALLPGIQPFLVEPVASRLTQSTPSLEDTTSIPLATSASRCVLLTAVQTARL